jgi:hypothetical protein
MTGRLLKMLDSYQGIASQLAEKLVRWRLGFEGVRLPAAPVLPLNDLRHGWKWLRKNSLVF